MEHKKIVIYGGAFSPPHLGHASVIEALLKFFPCDEIWVMPSADRYDKKVSASAEDRIKMLEIMISEIFPNPNTPIVVSRLEVDREKLTTTYDTMKELEEEYPDYEFYFVLGPDIVGDINKWVNGDKLINNTKTNFVTYKHTPDKLPNNLPPRLTILDTIHNNTTSTLVRDLIKNGKSGLPYITKGLSEYITNHDLYR